MTNTLSLFNGMSCGKMALDLLNIKGKYYYSEIDKHANNLTEFLYPDAISLGDVTKWRDWDIDWSSIDLFVGGSPCQGFSFAGKQLNFKDERSKLFFEFVDILNHIKKHNPDVLFLLENVNMAKEHRAVITQYMGVNPIRINSNLVSAQNRDRIYWTNIYMEPVGLFGDLECAIPQPEDKGIFLKDILEGDVPDKYFLSEKTINKIKRYNNGERCFTTADKAICLAAGYYKQGRDNQYIVASHGRNEELSVLTPRRTLYGKQIRKEYESGKVKEQRKNIQQLEPRHDGKTNALTSVQKDNLVFGADYRTDEGLRIRENGKSGTLAARARNDESFGQLAVSNTYIRRLTPKECLRLQNVPEELINKIMLSGISDTQLYKMAGNGWTVDVIKHIFSYIYLAL